MYEEILKDNNRSRRGKQMEKERRTKALCRNGRWASNAGTGLSYDDCKCSDRRVHESGWFER